MRIHHLVTLMSCCALSSCIFIQEYFPVPTGTLHYDIEGIGSWSGEVKMFRRGVVSSGCHTAETLMFESDSLDEGIFVHGRLTMNQEGEAQAEDLAESGLEFLRITTEEESIRIVAPSFTRTEPRPGELQLTASNPSIVDLGEDGVVLTTPLGETLTFTITDVPGVTSAFDAEITPSEWTDPESGEPLCTLKYPDF